MGDDVFRTEDKNSETAPKMDVSGEDEFIGGITESEEGTAIANEEEVGSDDPKGEEDKPDMSEDEVKEGTVEVRGIVEGGK